MRCHEAAEALVDESLPRPAGLQAHLERCLECRALAGLHASASRLRLPGPPPSAPIPREAILGEVRRRQRRRRVVASTAATAALAALVLLVLPRFEPPAPVAPGAPAAVAEEPASLGLLMGEVYGYTRSNPAVEDAAYRSFGTLAAWVRPPESTALEAPPFRTVLLPLHPPESLR
jgi:hypothetical protein